MAYSTRVLSFSPVAYWRLGEASGVTAADETGNHDGTYINTPTLGVTGLLVGDSNTAVSFDLSLDEKIFADHSGLDNLFHDGGALALIFKADTGHSVIQRIISKDAGTASFVDSYGGWGLTFDATTNKLGFYQRFTNGSSAVSNGLWETSAGAVVAGTQYHIVLSYDGSSTSNQPTLWINGVAASLTQVLIPSSGHTPRSDADAKLVIADNDSSQGAATRLFDGVLDEIALFPAVLSEAQAQALYFASIADYDLTLSDALLLTGATDTQQILIPLMADLLALLDTAGHDLGETFLDTLTDALSLVGAVDYDIPTALIETLAFIDNALYDLGGALIETLRLGETMSGDTTYERLFADSLRLNDTLVRSLGAMVSEALVLGDTPSYIRYWTQRLRDTLPLADEVDPEAIYARLIASALMFADLAANWDSEVLSDALAVADTIAASGVTYLALVEAFLAGDTSSFLATSVASVRDSLALTTAAAAAAVREALLGEDFVFALWDGENQSGYVGHVMNPAVGGLTQYTNYNFNSIAKIGGKYYGAADTGLYLLEGADDAGAAIDARVKLGALDFGFGYQSRVPQAYIGARANGKIVVKTFADDGKERWYEAQALHADLSTQRVKLGQGVKSRYWRFELINQDGAWLELEQIEFLPVVLTRRV